MSNLIELNGAIQAAAEEAQRVMKPDTPGLASIERILKLSAALEERLVLLMLQASIRHMNTQTAAARRCEQVGRGE